jgi:hypothetical protein
LAAQKSQLKMFAGKYELKGGDGDADDMDTTNLFAVI